MKGINDRQTEIESALVKIAEEGGKIINSASDIHAVKTIMGGSANTKYIIVTTRKGFNVTAYFKNDDSGQEYELVFRSRK